MESKILYLNNFRGFQNSYIPICDVNFLVGENSTGKTSVLSILKLMSSQRFFNSDEFNTEDIELGFFHELVSNNLKGKKYFQLGFYKNKQDIELNIFQAVLATYRNKNGEPVLSELRLLSRDYSILINYGEKSYRLKVKINDISLIEGEEMMTFKKWIDDTNFDELKYKTFVYDDESINDRPGFYDIRKWVQT